MICSRIAFLIVVIGFHIASFAAEGPNRDAAETAPPALEGTTWRVVAYRAESSLVPIETSETLPRIKLAEGRVSGNVGCNTFTGGFSLDEDRLTIEPRMAMTMMACEESLMNLEQAITARLAEVASYRQEGAGLELLDAEGETLLSLEALAEAPLTGVTWRLDAYNNGKGALVSLVGDTEITLTLSPDGRLSGSDGCNRYMSGYTLENGALMIGPIATTRMACRGPEAVAQQAAAYAAALGQARGYRIEAEQLWLTREDGATAALFRRIPDRD
jgi:heat shock protein HslJ